MKLLTEEKENKFEQFELRILVESEEDLIELWHRFNFGAISITDGYKSEFSRPIVNLNIADDRCNVWDFLNSKIKQLKIKL